MAKESPSNLNNNFFHKNLKILIITLFGLIVLVYFLLNKDTENILEKTVIPKWGKKYSARSLSDWSHLPGSPWDYVVGTKRGGWGATIDFYLIKLYFEKLNQIEPSYVNR